jgi:hypothetical protein
MDFLHLPFVIIDVAPRGVAAAALLLAKAMACRLPAQQKPF